jgi:hypothetical protein
VPGLQRETGAPVQLATRPQAIAFAPFRQADVASPPDCSPDGDGRRATATLSRTGP